LKKSRTKAVLVPWALTLILTSLCSTGCRKSPAPSKTDKGKQRVEVKSTLPLESLVVNLADPTGNCFLRLGLNLGLGQEVVAEGKGKGVPPATAQIRDTIISVLTRWQSDSLLAPDGKTKLKEELVKALRERLPEMGILEVYFTDFLVQR
jgi:flagellar basal body-associated protein FliL